MGLAWQQGPLARGAIGQFLVPDPLPERLLFAEPLRRRMRVKFGEVWVADSEDVVLLHEPGHYPVAYFPLADIVPDVLSQPTLTVEHGDRTIADTTRPLALYESGFAPRWYVPRQDVDQAALTAVEFQTFCPYKGVGLCRRVRAERDAGRTSNPGGGAAPHRRGLRRRTGWAARWKEIPSLVLVAEEDRMINPETQLFTAERMGAHVRARPIDHVPMITTPADVVQIILDAVTESSAR